MSSTLRELDNFRRWSDRYWHSRLLEVVQGNTLDQAAWLPCMGSSIDTQLACFLEEQVGCVDAKPLLRTSTSLWRRGDAAGQALRIAIAFVPLAIENQRHDLRAKILSRQAPKGPDPDEKPGP